jgi:hypothetical protein
VFGRPGPCGGARCCTSAGTPPCGVVELGQVAELGEPVELLPVGAVDAFDMAVTGRTAGRDQPVLDARLASQVAERAQPGRGPRRSLGVATAGPREHGVVVRLHDADAERVGRDHLRQELPRRRGVELVGHARHLQARAHVDRRPLIQPAVPAAHVHHVHLHLVPWVRPRIRPLPSLAPALLRLVQPRAHQDPVHPKHRQLSALGQPQMQPDAVGTVARRSPPGTDPLLQLHRRPSWAPLRPPAPVGQRLARPARLLPPPLPLVVRLPADTEVAAQLRYRPKPPPLHKPCQSGPNGEIPNVLRHRG